MSELFNRYNVCNIGYKCIGHQWYSENDVSDCYCPKDTTILLTNNNGIMYDKNGVVYKKCFGKYNARYYKTQNDNNNNNNNNNNNSNIQASLKQPVSIQIQEKISKPPQDNINLCFVGGVSTGKSTILNAIFSEQLTQCKIKRTTMVPTVYIENPDTWNPFEKASNTEQIYAEIAKKNKEIIELTEQGLSLDETAYSELVFNVGKLDINILEDAFVNVYDIPGLNDARTKDVYYKYLDTNFHQFNLMILLVDIHSGLNTSDEMDMLRFVTSRIQIQKELGRKIYALIVVNKADDMQWNNDTQQLELTGELSEMYEQTENTVVTEFTNKDVTDQLIGIVPLCAADAYLYRMVKKHGSGFHLTPEQILKIGINDMGKKFSTKKPDVQKIEVQRILENKDFVDEMIKLSGFQTFVNLLSRFLNTNGQNKELRINNILYEIGKLPELNNFNIYESTFINAIEQRCTMLNKIAKIDVQEYNRLMTELLENVKSLLHMSIITDYIKNPTELILVYRKFKHQIIDNYFSCYDNSSAYNSAGFSHIIVEKVVAQLVYDIDTNKHIDEYIKTFNILEEIGEFNANLIESMMSTIVNKEYPIMFAYTNGGVDELIVLLTKIKSLNVSCMQFVRYLLVCRYSQLEDREAIVKYMSYKSCGEIPICTMLLLNMSRNTFVKQIVNWVQGAGIDKLDEFYLGLF